MEPEIAAALAARRPVVALESSVIAQGLPIPANADALTRMIEAVERYGATPAVTAIVRGVPALGLDTASQARFLAREGVRKVAARDLAVAMAHGEDGATTVSGTLALMRLAGIDVFATGGIGGVHREPAYDESADLVELARTSAIVVCAGAKAILDLPATLERLDTLGVLVIGYRTSELPGFFADGTGLPVPHRLDGAADIVRVFRAHRSLGRPSAVLVVQAAPADASLARQEVEAAIARALAEARKVGVSGSAVTPFLLGAVERATGGRSLAANLALLEHNASLAAEIAVAMSAA
ncbi:MAG: pseudouridine-5'-phosphate glycosidase [Gemmatimonadetes bacterium]|nr:pseudouridine-5'-phosphate glycosidase [Gemmatimonadota bacterium]